MRPYSLNYLRDRLNNVIMNESLGLGIVFIIFPSQWRLCAYVEPLNIRQL